MRERTFFVPEQIIFFDEFAIRRDDGYEINPYFSTVRKIWFIDGKVSSLVEIGQKFNLDDEVLTVLKLTYGG